MTEEGGWKLVPVEPTPEMLRAFQSAFVAQLHKRRRHVELESAEKAGMRAMLAVAPTPSPDPIAQAVRASELVEPDGWFLYSAEHQHTGIIYRGDEHKPLPHADGAWTVHFQSLPTGGMLTGARGRTLAEAWANAVSAVRSRGQRSKP